MKRISYATFALCFALAASSAWAEREVRPQIYAPEKKSSTQNSSSEAKKNPPAPSRDERPPAPKEVRPAGLPPTPHGHLYPPPHGAYHHYYYGHYDPFYTPPPTTVVVYETREAEPVYVTTSIPDTIRLVNHFPMRFTVGLTGLFGPYSMNSEYRGYDFSGWIGGGGVTLQVPLNEANLGFITGAILTYRRATNTFDYYEDGVRTGETARYTFTHKNIDVPVLLRLRGTGSRLSFDFGGKLLFNILDELKIKDDSGSKTYDTYDGRNFLNFALALAFNIDLNRWLTFNCGTDFVFGDMYDTATIKGIPADFSEATFVIGLTFNIL